MDGEDGDVDRMEKGDDSSSDGDASDTEMQQQITELEAIVSLFREESGYPHVREHHILLGSPMSYAEYITACASRPCGLQSLL